MQDQMMRTITILAVAVLTGCGGKDWVLVDAVRHSEGTIVNQKVLVRDLARTLGSQGFSTNTPVIFTADPVNYPMSKYPTWTSNVIRIRYHRDWTHQQRQNAIYQIVLNGFDLSLDSADDKNAQPSSPAYGLAPAAEP